MSKVCCHCCGETAEEEVCEKCRSCLGILQFYSWETDFDDDSDMACHDWQS